MKIPQQNRVYGTEIAPQMEHLQPECVTKEIYPRQRCILNTITRAAKGDCGIAPCSGLKWMKGGQIEFTMRRLKSAD
jgi:hypothetical protein